MPSLLLFLSFLTFTKTYFILCCSCKALGFTGFKVVSYVDFSKYGATLPYNISLLFYSFSFTKTYFILCCSCKALGFTGFKVVSYVDFSKYGATLPYNISLLFYSFSSPPVDSLVLIICFCIMLLSIFIISLHYPTIYRYFFTHSLLLQLIL